MTDSLQNLVDALKQLPSIGDKSAWRMALWLMDQDKSVTARLSTTITDAKQRLRHCSICHTWTEDEVCGVCSSHKRDSSTICVVEKATDMFAIEKSGRFRGVYHVLGGLLSPMNGITVSSLNIASFMQRVEDSTPKEVILGLGGSSEAETTSHYITRLLEPYGTIVSVFSRGLSAGMEIEYADRYTLEKALNERRIINYNEE